MSILVLLEGLITGCCAEGWTLRGVLFNSMRCIPAVCNEFYGRFQTYNVTRSNVQNDSSPCKTFDFSGGRFVCTYFFLLV